MSWLMQHHGCRSLLQGNNTLTGMEERFDLVVESNDAILEKVVGLKHVWSVLGNNYTHASQINVFTHEQNTGCQECQ